MSLFSPYLVTDLLTVGSIALVGYALGDAFKTVEKSIGDAKRELLNSQNIIHDQIELALWKRSKSPKPTSVYSGDGEENDAANWADEFFQYVPAVPLKP